MTDTEMTNFIGTPVDDRDKEEMGESSLHVDANRDSSKDVDSELMEDGVDDTHDDELVNVYDKENHVIEVGKLSPNMDEFRISFKTYDVKHDFDAKTKWTDRKKFNAMCRGLDENNKPCKWRKHAVQSFVAETLQTKANLVKKTKTISEICAVKAKASCRKKK
ncbi:hypothetical protein D1007_51905 [Hordeum vulgare]|nr:hypothetical protein D1007_51905 [Hordeum vulgare]